MFDLHNDLLTYGLCDKEIDEIISNVSAAERKMICAVFTAHIKQEDIVSYSGYRQESVLLAVEDCTIINDFEFLGKLDPIYASLTWNYDNIYAGGAKEGGCLTTRGKDLIRFFNERGIVLDTAHLSRNSFYDAVELADTVMNSHTCFSAVREHFRNIDDEQIRAIIDKGGIVGLTLYKDFVTDKNTADYDDLYRHIDHFCSVFGHENLCFGTDFWGCDDSVKGLSNYEDFSAFASFLKTKGYSADVIDDIFFNNAAHFVDKVQSETKSGRKS